MKPKPEPDPYWSELGNRVRRLRTERDLTQVELAEHADISRLSVLRLEAGKMPSTETLHRLAGAFGYSLAALLRVPANAVERRCDVSGLWYLDNERPPRNGVMVIYVPGLGLDHSRFADHMEATHRAIAVTLEGFHPSDTQQQYIGIDQQACRLKQFVAARAGDNAIERVVFVGFSVGGDLVLETLAKHGHEIPRVHGALVLDCNVGRDTLFISRHIAAATGDDAIKHVISSIVQEASSESLDVLLAQLNYLTSVFDKMGKRPEALRRLAGDICDRFKDDVIPRPEKTFDGQIVRWLKAAVAPTRRIEVAMSAHKEQLRFFHYIFSPGGRASLAPLTPESIVATRQPVESHFDLEKATYLVPRVEQFIANLPPIASPTSPP